MAKQMNIVPTPWYQFYSYLEALFLFRIFVEFSPKLLHTTMVGGSFQIYSIQITGKCICKSKKLKIETFTHSPVQNSLSGSYHHPLAVLFSKIYSHLVKRRWDYDPRQKLDSRIDKDLREKFKNLKR